MFCKFYDLMIVAICHSFLLPLFSPKEEQQKQEHFNKERPAASWRKEGFMCGHVRETGSHKLQDRGVKERTVQDRDKLESPPEKIPFSFCLPHSCLTLCLISPCQHKSSEVSLFINPLLYQEYSSVAQNILF